MITWEQAKDLKSGQRIYGYTMPSAGSWLKMNPIIVYRVVVSASEFGVFVMNQNYGANSLMFWDKSMDDAGNLWHDSRKPVGGIPDVYLTSAEALAAGKAYAAKQKHDEQ